MLFILGAVPVVFAVLVLFLYLLKYKHLIEITKNIPSPPSLPIIGHGHYFIGRQAHEIFLKMSDFFLNHGDTIKLWFGPDLNIFSIDVKFIKAVISSTRFNDKADEYDVLKPWLQEGLLISRGQKWHKRRKIITPAFHFKILEQFVEVFECESRLLLKNLEKEYHMQSQNGFALYDYISLCTLDAICATAMGVSANAQINADSEYVHAVKTISVVSHKRMTNAFYRFNFIYNLTPLARKEKKALQILHDFTANIIRQRREKLLKSAGSNNNEKTEDEDIGTKRKMAFLDILLQSEIDGKPLTNLDIREEVDTFMFEGHDTTTSAVTFLFYNLAISPECQLKCFEEIVSIIGTDPSTPITYENLNNMRYVELCIKESLRLFPSVPAIGRKVLQDCEINGRIIPAGTSIGILPVFMGRKEELFPEPNKFKPERFDIIMNSEKMDPYAYIPFSAGPRNCIGQKFGVLEIKTIVANVLRQYKIEFVDDGKEIFLVAELILRTKDPLMFKITSRFN